MNESTKIKLIAVAFMLVLAGVGVFAYLQVMRSEPAPEPQPAIVPQEPSAPLPTPPPEAPAQAEAPTKAPPEPQKPLDDEGIRKWFSSLSPQAEIARWAHREHLKGKFIAFTETLASGRSPRALATFLGPEGSFQVSERGGKEFVSPLSYERYDILAQAFASLDVQGCARLYKRLSPELEAEYSQMAKPGQTFRQTLVRALSELLRVPVMEQEVLLERIEVNLKIADPDLEAMSEAQKHLFRMGPANIKVIQSKIRQLGRAAGLSTDLRTVKPISCKSCPR